jgi:hypothetical protein
VPAWPERSVLSVKTTATFISATVAIALMGSGAVRAGLLAEATDPALRTAQQTMDPGSSHKQGPPPRRVSPPSKYPRNVESDYAIINRVWRAAGQPSPFNPQSTPRLRAVLKNAPSYGRAVRALQYAIEHSSNSAAMQELWKAANAAARETRASISEVLYVVMVESIRDANKRKRMALERLQELNDINDALGESLKDLTDASGRLADRESKGEADAKEQVAYTRYRTGAVGSAKQSIGLTTVRKSMTRSQLNSEMKTLESEREDLRNRKQQAENEFQHLDQAVNQTMQSLTRILRSLADMRKQGAASKSGL